MAATNPLAGRCWPYGQHPPPARFGPIRCGYPLARAGSRLRRVDLQLRRDARHPAAALRQGLPLPVARRGAGDGGGHAGAHPEAGDPARLPRRLDLPRSRRPSAGDRPRRQGAQAVPLPPSLDRTARGHKVRPHAGFLPRPAASARAGERRPRPSRPSAGEGAGRRGPPAGNHADPRRQRELCPREQELWPDHAARRPHRDRGVGGPLLLQGQVGQGMDRLAARPPVGARRRCLPRRAGRRAVPVSRPRRAAPRRDLRRRQRLSARGDRRRFHRQGLPHLGRHGAGRHGSARVRELRQRQRRQAQRHPRHRAGRHPPGQHPQRLPQELRPPRGAGRLSGGRPAGVAEA